MEKLIKIINEAQSIAIISHIDEDTDAFASSLAMQEMLKNNKKNVFLYLSRPVEKRMSFWSNEYEVYDEEKEYGEFDLVICLDSGDLGRLGKRSALLNKAKKTVSIDHHYTNTLYAMENLVDAKMSSTCEMVYDLFVEMGVEITAKIAEFLYGGIMGDTGMLKYSCATPKTALTISKLMETGFDHAQLCRRLFDIEPVNTIRLKGYIMNNIESYYDQRVSVAVVDDEILNKFGVGDNDTGDIVDIPRKVYGTEIAVLIKKADDTVKISLRSNGRYNVGEIAKRLGGGGHEMAAGIRMGNCDINEAKDKVIGLIGEYING